jgi:hypothetical protein
LFAVQKPSASRRRLFFERNEGGAEVHALPPAFTNPYARIGIVRTPAVFRRYQPFDCRQETHMKMLAKTTVTAFAAASLLALAACNSPTAQQEADEAEAAAEAAGDEAAQAASAAGDAAVQGAEAAGTATAEAAGEAAAAVDAAADPVQQAYEEGKANAADSIGNAAQDVSDSMKDEAAEAEATAEEETQD